MTQSTSLTSTLDRLRQAVAPWLRPNGAKPEPAPVEVDVERLAPALTPADALWVHVPYAAAEMQGWTRAQLDARRTGDPWLDNMLLNKFEFATGVARMESFPHRFSVPFVLCNARCDFCSAWLVQGEPMPIELIDRLDAVMPYLAEIDMVGWGEPLIHPQFAQILDTLQRRADPRANVTLTTNGVHLEKWVDRLQLAKVRTVSVSIHAATPATHEDLMGLPAGSFDKVIAALKALVARRTDETPINVGLAFIVTQQNVHEIPQFLRMAQDLGVSSVFLRTLQGRSSENDGLDYHRLPPYLHPQFEELRTLAVEAIDAARLDGRLLIEASPESWSTPVYPANIEPQMLARPLTSREVRRTTKTFRRQPTPDGPHLPLGRRLPPVQNRSPAPPAENPYDRAAPLQCPSPYTALYINGFDRQVTPCCYMSVAPDHEPVYLREGASFDDVWNAPAMVEVRRSLHEGPLMPACLKCPFFF